MLRILILIPLLYSSLAYANYECQLTLFVPGRDTVTKTLDLYPDPKKPNLFMNRLGDYKMTILQRDLNHIEKVMLTELNSSRESVSSFTGWRGEALMRPFDGPRGG